MTPRDLYRVLRLTRAALIQKLSARWKEKASQKNVSSSAAARPIVGALDQIQGQWEKCLHGCSFLTRLIRLAYLRSVSLALIPIQGTALYTFFTSPCVSVLTAPAKSIPMQAKTESEDLKEVRGDGAGSSHTPLLPGECPAPCLVPRPPESMYLHLSGKHKVFLDEEPLVKRKRSQKSAMASDSHKRAELAALQQEMEGGRSEPDLERSPLPEADQKSGEAWMAPLGELGPGQGAPMSSREDGVPGKHLEELGSQRPPVMAEVANKGWPPASRSSSGAEQGRAPPQEVAKGPFVAVVGITEAVVDGGAPIQLIPFGREERAEHRRGAEERSQMRAVPGSEKGEAGDNGALSQPKAKDQKPERRLESILSERDLLQQKVRDAVVLGLKSDDRGEGGGMEVPSEGTSQDLREGSPVARGARWPRRLGHLVSMCVCVCVCARVSFGLQVQELEEEKRHWQNEFERTQHELMTLRARESESLYWSKKHMGYRQAEMQVLKSELERSLEEKSELKERLKAMEMRVEVLHAAQGSFQNLQEEDPSPLEKLKGLRVNVSRLLASILPHLELEEVNFESDQVDEILQTVLETNHILE
ncbi:MORC family CW-type zinc finger protein 4 [Sarcophilus harrisii]